MDTAGTIVGWVQPPSNTPTASALIQITTGHDGSIWATQQGGNFVVRVTQQADGSFATREYSIGRPQNDINIGPDGMVWFTAGDRIGRIDPNSTAADGVLTWFTNLYPAGYGQTFGIAAGPDGSMWYTVWNSQSLQPGAVFRLAPGAGGTLVPTKITDTGPDPYLLVTGPDGNVWVTEADYRNFSGTPRTSAVSRITTTGSRTAYALPSGTWPFAITPGIDGNVWFTWAAGPLPASVG